MPLPPLIKKEFLHSVLAAMKHISQVSNCFLSVDACLQNIGTFFEKNATFHFTADRLSEPLPDPG